MSTPRPQSVLGLDLGKRRIGLAGCDALGITVTRLPAVISVDFESDLKQIRYYCLARKVKGLIVGLPLDNNGKETKQSKFCKRYGKKLAYALNLPIVWVNEHSSSWEALQRLNLKNDRSGRIDSEAAGLLLEQWLKDGPDLNQEETIASSS